MIRIKGLMPTTEIKVEKIYILDDSKEVRVQAGPNGYTIVYPDYSTDYADITATTEENFNTAITFLTNTYSVVVPKYQYAPKKKYN